MLKTFKDEQQEMLKGRILCILLFIFITAFICSFTRLSLDPKHFWIFRISSKKQIGINAFYTILITCFVFVLWMLIEPFTLAIRRHTFTIPKLELTSLKIAHITDTHVHYPHPQVTPDRLKRIMKKINKEKPDIVVYTGDLMSDNSTHAEKDIDTICEALKIIEAPVYVCFGNHDVACHNELIRRLQEIGIHTLEQQTETLQINGKSIYISGLKPSLNLHTTEQYVNNIVENFTGDPNCLHILLAHMPDAADEAAASGAFDIQLSGHSHGGQCVLPFHGGNPILPPGCVKYHGCVYPNYIVGNMILHISRGVGVTPFPFPPIRFLCKPEISILTIVPGPILC